MKAIAIVLIWWFILYNLAMSRFREGKCPRELAGYSCRGEGCDHSEECMRKTKQMIKERRPKDEWRR